MKQRHNWKYKLKEDKPFLLAWLPPHIRLDLPWISIANSVLTVKAGYAWDGASPSGLFWDTWDGPMCEEEELPLTYWATLLHDAIYQYIREIAEVLGWPIRRVRRRGDKSFLDEMRKKKFDYSRLYYRAVRAFGWVPVLKRRMGWSE